MSEPAPGASSPDEARRERLRDILLQAANSEGFVPFDRFMDLALYGEGVGFYARASNSLGTEGDFYTAAHVSPLFGRTLAKHLGTALRSLGPDGRIRVLELGPGDGTLGAILIEELARDPPLHDRLEYVLVDRSATLSARAFERVSAIAESVQIPVSAAAGVGAAGPFRGVVLANELLDAQPARRLEWSGHAWRELGVKITSDGYVPASGPLDRWVPLPELPRPTVPGTILEVSPMAEGIVREVADHLVAGRFLVLDFGMGESELLTGHPSGTLSAVRRHRSGTDPFADPGSSDLSVFVNLTRVRAAAASSGLSEVGFGKQADALGAWGFPEVLDDAVRSARSAEDEVRVRMGAKSLLFGFDRFFALELAPSAGPARWPEVR